MSEHLYHAVLMADVAFWLAILLVVLGLTRKR